MFSNLEEISYPADLEICLYNLELAIELDIDDMLSVYRAVRQ